MHKQYATRELYRHGESKRTLRRKYMMYREKCWCAFVRLDQCYIIRKSVSFPPFLFFFFLLLSLVHRSIIGEKKIIVLDI